VEPLGLGCELLERDQLVGGRVERSHLVRLDLVEELLVGHDVVWRDVVGRHMVRRDVVLHHLVGQHLVGQHLVRQHLVRQHLVWQHLVWEHLVERRLGIGRAGLTRSHDDRRVWLLSATLAAAAVGMYLTSVRDLSGLDAPLHVPWWVLAPAFGLAEICVVHLELRKDSQTFSMSEIPLVVGLFLATPSDLVIGQLLGGALALSLYRRQQPMKLAFNVGNLALQACLAVSVFHAIVGPNPIGPSGWAGAFAATVLALVASDLLIHLAITLAGGSLGTSRWYQLLGLGVFSTITNTSLGLIGITVLWLEPAAAWLLLIPSAAAFLAYRLYQSGRKTQASLRSLHESTTLAHEEIESETVIAALLRQACEMLRAEIAQVTVFDASGDSSAIVTTIGPGELVDVKRGVALNPLEGVWARVASEDRGIALPAPIDNNRLRLHFLSHGIRDAVVVPLRGESGVVGTLLVANRLGDLHTFGSEDLELCETLANNICLALGKARLAVLADSVDRLTELNRLKDDFVAMVSHELRTPLTSIKGYVKTLLRPEIEIEPDQQQSFLASIDGQTDRLCRLIDDLLVVSCLESGTDELHMLPVSLSDVAVQVVNDLDDRATGRTIAIRMDKLPIVMTDASKVQQIISNLVENALKYTPAGSRVVVTGSVDVDGVVVSVEDDGRGIPRDFHERIFDRFVQVDTTSTREVGGAGLGLYICRRLARAIGGQLRLERSDEHGSVFTLRLPLEAVSSRSA
jgi:signal transduction histidine kinase